MDAPKSARHTFCEFCGEPVNIRAKGTFEFGTGWVMYRGAGAGGGVHAVSLFKGTGKWACRRCIEDRVRGTVGQSSLLPEERRA